SQVLAEAVKNSTQAESQNPGAPEPSGGGSLQDATTQSEGAAVSTSQVFNDLLNRNVQAAWQNAGAPDTLRHLQPQGSKSQPDALGTNSNETGGLRTVSQTLTEAMTNNT